MASKRASKSMKEQPYISEKPSWENAPIWANYLCQSKSGAWFWSLFKPQINHLYIDKWNFQLGENGARCAMAEYGDDLDHPNWRKSLEERPKYAISNQSKA